MTKEQSLRSQIKSRFVDYLKAAELMYVHPELTNCPHCNRHASVIQNFMWSCPECHKHGDVVDYVMALEHLDTEWVAINASAALCKSKLPLWMSSTPMS